MAAIRKALYRGENLRNRGRLMAGACSAAAALTIATPAAVSASTATGSARSVPAKTSGWYLTAGPAAAATPGCAKGARVRKVVATYKALKLKANGEKANGYRTDTLYCGNNDYGYRHLEKHVGQYPSGLGFFNFSMAQTLKAPADVKAQGNGNFRESAPIYQCFYQGYYVIWTFVVVPKINSGDIVTAWGSKGKTVNRSCPR